MQKTKNRIIVFTLVFALSLAPYLLPVTGYNVAIAQAATPKISKSKVTLEVGKSTTLSIKNTKKTVTWKSSKKSVATVSKKGKVTAKAAGVAKITATVSGKSYTCTVTVKKPVNPALKKAPFKGVELNVGKLSMVVPEHWASELKNSDDNNFEINVIKDTTFAQVTLAEEESDYDQYKAILKLFMTEETLIEMMKELYNTTYTISDYKTEDISTEKIKTFKISCLFHDTDDITIALSYYYVNAYGYTGQFIIAEEATGTLSSDTEYIINSIQPKK